MNFYIIQTIETLPDGNMKIIWHKHLYCFFEDAVKACLEKGPGACVLKFEQVDSFPYESVKKENGDGIRLLKDS